MISGEPRFSSLTGEGVGGCVESFTRLIVADGYDQRRPVVIASRNYEACPERSRMGGNHVGLPEQVTLGTTPPPRCLHGNLYFPTV